jgi:nucleoside-diphosphate-sugar epimerase
LTFLLDSHETVVTVRSATKGSFLVNQFKSSGKISFVVVEDVAAPNAFDRAVQSTPAFDGIIHSASPFHFNIEDAKKDILDPAINGTTNILTAAAEYAPSVRRIVITSSLGAMLSMPTHPDEYNETVWNPTTMEQALNNFALTYNASKKFAELAAWEFLSEKKPAFSLATINPPFVFGPVIHDLRSLDNINTSNARILSAANGGFKDKIPPTGSFMWVDVRDVALAHVRALERPDAGGHRFLLVSSFWTNKDLVEIIGTHFPDLGRNLPEDIKSDMPTKMFTFDVKPSQSILGLHYTQFEKSVVETLKSLLAIDPSLGHK